MGLSSHTAEQPAEISRNSVALGTGTRNSAATKNNASQQSRREGTVAPSGGARRQASAGGDLEEQISFLVMDAVYQ
jgi:hypothetical protein